MCYYIFDIGEIFEQSKNFPLVVACHFLLNQIVVETQYAFAGPIFLIKLEIAGNQP